MIPVLFAMPDSVYKSMPAADVYDEARDARTYPGGRPIVAHPPCRAWSRLRMQSKHPPTEPALALWAVEQVRTFGGVLEHPAASKLWPAAGLPMPGCPADTFGGYTIALEQFHFGHRAAKPTWLYIVGCPPWFLPVIPFREGEPSHVVQTRKRGPGARPHLGKKERSATPPAFAAWLLDVAGRCGRVA